jgi:hypothetical protein
MAKPRQSAAGKERKAPVSYSPEIAAEIIDRIENGESIRGICDSDPERFPTSGAFCQWLEAQPELAKQYARATSERAAKLAHETIAIADDLTEDANSRRVRIDARKWFAAKLDPKRWGDKQTIETSGVDGAPIQQETTLRITFDGK